jgi:hypothetical protein
LCINLITNEKLKQNIDRKGKGVLLARNFS